jgi:NRAMP (natural resistance-associated macrophage protein)-like metal ion transporter
MRTHDPPSTIEDPPRKTDSPPVIDPPLTSGSYDTSVPAPDYRLGDRRTPAHRRGLRNLLSVLGPGLITGASDDDPSGVGTYSATGAATGYRYLWTALITWPMMSAVQGICGRIALVTGKGFAAAIRQCYPRRVLFPLVGLLVFANTFNVGADLAAIASGINLLVPLPIPLLIPVIAVGLMLLQLFAKYTTINRIFKWLSLALLAYVATAIFAHPDWLQVLRGTVIPTIPRTKDEIGLMIAILGTTISPYLFFWQAGQEVEQENVDGVTSAEQRRAQAPQAIANEKLDTNIGMFASNLVMYFIILTTAATLHVSGQTSIQSATDAAQAFRPLLGPAAEFVFAIGIIGAGLLAVPVLTGSSAYAVAEAHDWPGGLGLQIKQARGFYGVIVLSTLEAMLVGVIGISPFQALLYSAILNGLIAPPLLWILMRMSNRRDIMGEYTNGRLTNVLGWATFALMTVATVAYLVTLVM